LKNMELYNEKYGTPFFVFLLNTNYKKTTLQAFLLKHFS
jgi:hypothetical protein